MKTIKTVAVVLVLMMALAIAPAALAYSNKQEGRAFAREAKADWTNQQAKYDQMKTAFVAGRAQYQSIHAKMQRSGESLTQADIPVVRDFMHNTIDFMMVAVDKYVAFLKSSPGNYAATINELEGYKTRLNSLNSDVDSASTRDDFRTIATSIRDEWNDVKEQGRNITCEAATDRILNAMSAWEAYYDTAKTRVDREKASGNQKADRWLANLQDARASYDAGLVRAQEAKTMCQSAGNAGDFNQAAKDINNIRNDAVRKVVEASNKLRQALK